MNTDKSSREPRQQRSRATAERLLNATIAVLDQAGLEAALIPRIAAAANVAPANVYRRFADKNALLRAAFMHALTQSNVSNRAQLTAQLLGTSLSASARNLITMLFDQYQRHPHFLRALSRFIDTDTDPHFVQQARALVGANVDLLVDVLLAHRSEIAHVPAQPALRFAVLNATCSIEAYTLDPHSIWHVQPSLSCAQLTDSLVHSFVAHLTTG